jgi:tetratricopeptide (TPR) repeat protein
VTATPLVSIIVRSRGLGGLHAALTSIAAQTYGRIEVIVVDTTGHPDSAWPAIDWRADFAVRWLSGGQRLDDPRAANLALDAVQGDWFCFVDDDGVLDAPHVERLVRAAQHDPQALVFYGRCRLAGAGDATTLAGRPLNRALFFHEQTLCLPAALIRRSALERGCRFDETLALGAEHDFLEQLASCGEFVFLDHAPPTCQLTPRHRGGIARRVYYDNLRFAKWTGASVQHGLRAAFGCERAMRQLDAGDRAAARAAFERVLAQYPGNPDALHGLARCELAAGRADSAWPLIVAAIEFDPSNADYRRTAGAIRQRLHGGDTGAAFLHHEPTPAVFTASSVAPPVAVASGTAVARNGPCPCGSGKRYKHCCGLLADAPTVPPAAADSPADRIRCAQRLLQRGAASEAAALLARIAPLDVDDARLALDAGRCYMQMQLLQPAFTLIERAIDLDGALNEAVAACDECCHEMFRLHAWQSAGRAIQALLEQQNAAAPATAAAGEIHIVCELGTVGGTERRALNLYQLLSPHARVTLWTTVPPLASYGSEAPVRLIAPGRAPAGGTLVLVGTYFACGEWLETAPFERIVICHNLAEQFPSLMQRLVQIAANPARPRVQLTFPSHLFRDTMGLSGTVEYSSVDLGAFSRRVQPPVGRPRIVVGRHNRAYHLKFHPNDPEFFRGLVARGYDVRILGGTVIAGAFDHGASSGPELLGVDAEPARDFLERLDIFVYRKHPRFFETGGTSVLEAMAMELPVVVFREQCGIAEIIRDGDNGFLVDSEAQAIDVIDRLARDRELRARTGAAARASVTALFDEQTPRLLEFYLGSHPRARRAQAPAWWRRLFGPTGPRRARPQAT